MLKKKFDLITKQTILSILVFSYIYKQLNIDSFNKPINLYDCLYFSFKNQLFMDVDEIKPISDRAKIISCAQNYISFVIIISQL